jgi:Family of unknown function (DUF5824)
MSSSSSKRHRSLSPTPSSKRQRSLSPTPSSTPQRSRLSSTPSSKPQRSLRDFELLLGTDTSLKLISDDSTYSFVFYGEKQGCFTLNGMSFNQFCVKITILGSKKTEYSYTTVDNETINKYISTEKALKKEVSLQKSLDFNFRQSKHRPIVPYVIHDCLLLPDEFIQLFSIQRGEQKIRHVINAIEGQLETPDRKVHMFFMEYMDKHTSFKDNSQHNIRDKPLARTTYHRMAAILSCVAGCSVVPYDASEPNVMLDTRANDVRLIDFGNTFDWIRDQPEIITLCSDVVDRVSKSTFEDQENIYIPTIDQLEHFRSYNPKITFVDLRVMRNISVENIHQNLIMLAFVDFMKNLMINLDSKLVEPLPTSYCKSRFAMESVYGKDSFVTFGKFLEKFFEFKDEYRENLTIIMGYILEIIDNIPIPKGSAVGSKCSILGGGSKPTFIKRYLPDTLSTRDKTRQRKELTKSRRLYKQGKYYTRKAMRSFKSKPSKHIDRAISLYHVDKIRPTRELSRATGCSLKGLRRIVKKGEGAYYSSGSRPNQTSQSWGNARLASAITGGNASLVDFHILNEECDHRKSAYRLAQKPRN